MKISRRLILLTLFFALALTIVPFSVSYAASQTQICPNGDGIPLRFQVPIPFLGSEVCIKDTGIARYIEAVYNFLLISVGVLATVMIIWGGFVWLTAAGSQERITKAKGYIGGAVTGLVLLFGAYTILYLINPELTKLKPLAVKKLEEIAFAKEETCEAVQRQYSNERMPQLLEFQECADSDCKNKTQTKTSSPTSTTCGKTYSYKLAGQEGEAKAMCKGIQCSSGQICDTKAKDIGCYEIGMLLEFKAQQHLICRNRYPVEVKTFVVCPNKYDPSEIDDPFPLPNQSEPHYISNIDQNYIFQITQAKPSFTCSDQSSDEKFRNNARIAPLGYFFGASIFDNDGITCGGTKINDAFYIGKNSCNGGRPLAVKNRPTKEQLKNLKDQLFTFDQQNRFTPNRCLIDLNLPAWESYD